MKPRATDFHAEFENSQKEKLLCTALFSDIKKRGKK